MKTISALCVILVVIFLGMGSLLGGSYTFTPVNYPGASATVCGGINGGGTLSCTYVTTGSNAEQSGYGFTLSGGTYNQVNYPGSWGTWLDGSPNDAGDVVGEYQTKTLCNGFLFSQGTYTSLTYPGATGCTCAIGINNAGTIVGRYKMNGVTSGFILSNGAYTSLTYPGATYTRASNINNNGVVVGEYQDAIGVSHGFVLNNGTYTSVDYPGASQNPNAFSGTVAGGINDSGTIVGYYTDVSGVVHGFVLTGGIYTTLDYPGASLTAAFGINNGGVIAGTYGDAEGVNHGFITTPIPAPTLTLTLTKSGAGSGIITSSPSGINCGSTCSAPYASDTVVTLTATPDAGSYFAGWSAPCSGNGSCTVTTTANTQVTATFYPQSYLDTAQKLYIGYYQRPADPAGLIFWVNGLSTVDANHDGIFVREDILPILAQFANSDEAKSLYNGDITGSNIATVIDSIYMGLFNRHAEPGGLAFYVNGFNAGGETPATILWSVMNGAQGTDAQSVQNKLVAANRFIQVLDPDLGGTPPFQATYAGDADALSARQWLAGVTWDPATIPDLTQTTTYMKSAIADPGDPILNFSGSSVERALAQTGLSIALASNVLQSQVQVFFKSGSASLPCSALNGGGSVQTGAIPTTVIEGNPLYPVTLYYDNHCTQPYIAVDVTGATQTGTGTGILSESVAYYGLDGRALGTMTLSETLVETGDLETVQAYGLGTFTPASGSQTPVQLGLSCDISLRGTTFPCTGGVAQDFPALGLAIGSVTSLTLNIPGGALGTGAVTFAGSNSVVTGPIGSLAITNPSPASFVIQGGTPYTTNTASGGAAALALFPPTPTAWTFTDTVNNEKLDIAVIDDAARTLSLTITQVSTGKTLASGPIDQSGTGTLTYSDGWSAAITNWTLAD